MRGAILVTGAAGFAGGHLLDLLSRDGADLWGWHRPGRAAPSGFPGVRWQAVDLLDRTAVHVALRDAAPSAVFHCAGAAHVARASDDTEATFAVNVRGTHHLLEGLREAQLAIPVLVPSSAMVYRPATEPLSEDDPLVPANLYGVSKLAQEMLAARAARDGIGVRIARSFNHVGPRQSSAFAASGFARQIAEIESGRRSPEIVVGNLEARREVTDVRDTVRAYHLLLQRGTIGRPYNVCSGRAVQIGEALDRLIAKARVGVRIRVDEGRLRPNDMPLLEGNPRRIRDELGWAPAISLDRTLDDLLEYWRAQMQ